MMIIGFMPSEGLDEVADTLKEMYEFYAIPPAKSLPSAHSSEMNGLVASIE